MRTVLVVLLICFPPAYAADADDRPSMPSHPCFTNGYRLLDITEEAKRIALPALAASLEAQGWLCSADRESVICERLRLADPEKGAYSKDGWESEYVCIEDDEATKFVARYRQVDGVIAYRNKYPARFGWAENAESSGWLLFQSKVPVSGQVKAR